MKFLIFCWETIQPDNSAATGSMISSLIIRLILVEFNRPAIGQHGIAQLAVSGCNCF